MKSKIIFFGLVILLFISSAFAINGDEMLDAELPMEFEVTKATLWDNIVSWFDVGDFSTIKDMGAKVVRERGEYFDARTRFKCESQGYGQRFTLGWNVIGSNSLQTFGQVKTLENQLCEPGIWYNLVIRNVEVPDFSDSMCGSYYNLKVRHERQTSYGGSWVTDTDAVTSNIAGFEDIALVQIECAVDACEGLTGRTTGSNFCDGTNVVKYQYTDIVRDGECFKNFKVIQNCGSVGCYDGSCNVATTKIYGYIFENNACFNTYYMSDESAPSGFYTSKITCETNIVYEEDPITTTSTIDVYLLNDNVCEFVTVDEDKLPNIYYLNSADCEGDIIITEDEDNETSSTEDDEETKISFWQSIINWFKELFSK